MVLKSNFAFSSEEGLIILKSSDTKIDTSWQNLRLSFFGLASRAVLNNGNATAALFTDTADTSRL